MTNKRKKDECHKITVSQTERETMTETYIERNKDNIQ
jgi:hypothetical protein